MQPEKLPLPEIFKGFAHKYPLKVSYCDQSVLINKQKKRKWRYHNE